MTMPDIRPMQAEDRDAVVQLLADSEPWTTLGYTSADWHRIFCPLPQGRESLVALVDGKVAGVALIREKFLLGDYLELLGVAPGTRKMGIGAALLAQVERSVFSRTKNLFACVSDFNATARAFYQKNGYQEIGPMPNFLIPGSAEILLRKTNGPAREKKA
ncbi:MAG: GNAT family N-acetyltransferase [Nitrospirota bacterium]|nr:GNAT family N-acetyltransferase [Nitrospirota bacterium]MDP2383974.1 GNAT family N-acetyltransferase [Nitrospirota bacterium]MDP3596116.1 GNAT family N-acetyltransferase [Nitrospirota bacterium]